MDLTHPALIRAMFVCKCPKEAFDRGPFTDSRVSNRPCHTLARHAVYAWLREFVCMSYGDIAVLTGTSATGVRDGIRAFWGRGQGLYLLRGEEAPDGPVVVSVQDAGQVVHQMQGLRSDKQAVSLPKQPPEAEVGVCSVVREEQGCAQSASPGEVPGGT